MLADKAERHLRNGFAYITMLPRMVLLTYQLPDEIREIALQGEFDEFDLNAFFEASGAGSKAQFKHKSDVQKWLDIIRGGYAPQSVEHLKTGTRPPVPYSDVRLLPYLQHSFWFLPNVAASYAMASLLAEKQNIFWRDYAVVVAAGTSASSRDRATRAACSPVCAGGNGDCGEVPEYLMDLRLDALHQLHGGGIETDLSRQVHGVADPHGLRIGADRSGCVGSLDDAFVHA